MLEIEVGSGADESSIALPASSATPPPRQAPACPPFPTSINPPFPLSPQVLAYLHEALGAEVMLTLNPDRGLADLPVKGFLRYVLPRGDGAPPAARFDGLPADQTLTLGMEVPEPWLVEPVATDHDLDNIRLAELAPGQRLAATFELEALLVTGSAIDLGAARSGDPSQEVRQGGRGVKGLLVSSRGAGILNTAENTAPAREQGRQGS